MSIASSLMDLTRYITCLILAMLLLRHLLWQIILSLRCFLRDLPAIFVTGHFEYDRDTLAEEYWRDFHKGLPIRLPENYFPDNDPEKQPLFTWRAHANLLYRNWINWVYQMTPYNTDEIPSAIAELRQRVAKADPDARMTGRF